MRKDIAVCFCVNSVIHSFGCHGGVVVNHRVVFGCNDGEMRALRIRRAIMVGRGVGLNHVLVQQRGCRNDVGGIERGFFVVGSKEGDVFRRGHMQSASVHYFRTNSIANFAGCLHGATSRVTKYATVFVKFHQFHFVGSNVYILRVAGKRV